MKKKQIQQELPTFAPEAPDAFTMLDAMISKTGNVEYNGPSRTVSVRMNLIEYCTLESFSQFSGQSKNKIVNQMIAACVERLTESLSAEDLEGIQEIRSRLISELMDEELKANLGGK